MGEGLSPRLPIVRLLRSGFHRVVVDMRGLKVPHRPASCARRGPFSVLSSLLHSLVCVIMKTLLTHDVRTFNSRGHVL